jgi:2-keto-3-deoxy-L-rhamnonate aldolase RhmA
MLKHALGQGLPVVGTMLRLIRNTAVLPVAADAGLDFVMLDLEHGPYSLETVADMAVVARAHGIGLLARVPELARGYVSRALDCGLDGVMVPMLERPEQARQLAEWSKYSPVGRRGLSTTGGHTGYRKIGSAVETMEQLNGRTLAIAQVETVLGVENAAAIAATDGIDALLVGPNDLACSLGKPGQLDCAEEEDAIARVAAAAADAGKAFGMHAGAEMLRRWAGHGMTLVMSSMDIYVLSSGLRRLNEETRGIV